MEKDLNIEKFLHGLQPVETFERIYPEIKKSDDTKIKKALYILIKEIERSGITLINDISTSSMLNWVEKQGEQEEPQAYKPKFKVGDWVVVAGFPLLICDIRSNTYETICNEHRIFDIDVLDKVAHLWTIEDAKDDDVLVCESGWTCIFKTLVNEETFSSYCFMDSTGWFCELGSKCHTLKEEFVKAYNGKIHPATKEQRDLLFQKMNEAGYKWDSENKKPIKI